VKYSRPLVGHSERCGLDSRAPRARPGNATYFFVNLLWVKAGNEQFVKDGRNFARHWVMFFPSDDVV